MVRWLLINDLALLKDMMVNFPKSSADWHLLAERICTEEFKVTGRGARERWLKTVYAKFKASNADQLKRSGR